MNTKHFSIEEVQHSNYATEHGIDNTLPSKYYGNAMNLAMFVLEPIRQHWGIPFSPTSWYRCERVNGGVGGEPDSQHLIGQAADISVPKVSLMALAEYIRDNLTFDQLILEPGWVHVSYNKDDNRMEVLHKTDTGYAKGLV